jgi:hypothetical protein
VGEGPAGVPGIELYCNGPARVETRLLVIMVLPEQRMDKSDK